MIEKMTFLSITGLKEDIDHVIEKHISKFDIQLENSLLELKNIKGLLPYAESNPYKEDFAIAKELFKIMDVKKTQLSLDILDDVEITKSVELINSLNVKISDITRQKDEVLNKKNEYENKLNAVRKYIGLDYDLSSILGFKHIRFRFGRMHKEYYEKFMAFVYYNIDSIFYKCQEDKDYIWAVYFVPELIHEKVDAIYTSMHFERFFLPDGYEGTPEGAVNILNEYIKKCDLDLDKLEDKLKDLIDTKREDFIVAYEKLKQYNNNFDIRKLAAVTKNTQKPFYILCGWMPKKEAQKFYERIEQDPKTFCIIENDHNNIYSKPPVKLKNNFLFKPFELFVDMYGLPSYDEFDPTILISILYSFIFGFMFGDVGQGFVLFALGLFIAHYKKSKLAGIIARCGIFSMIFGFLFGSIFGFEDLIPALWLHPSKAITKLPIIGNLNTVFVVTIALGMLIIIMTMILNIISRLKLRQLGEALFDANGIAGFVFYISGCLSIVLLMLGKSLPAFFIILIMFILPLLIIFFKEPLIHLIERKSNIFPNDKAMFIIQGIFELVEVLLSYFSNTISFVRIGAFAVSHAAMMEVVLMLAGAHSGNTNWLVIVIGNIFVMGMEGLIVGIQVLRLQYYELFSRFYKGGGRAFVPYGKNL